jgi:hypothetical protein
LHIPEIDQLAYPVKYLGLISSEKRWRGPERLNRI